MAMEEKQTHPEEKQTHLDLEASIPRPSKSDECRLSPIHNIILIVLLVAFSSTLVVLFILSPNSLKIHVTDASLAQFNLTTDNALHYNLALNISIRNPNRRIGLYYDTIKANAYYEGQIFGTVTLAPFYQGHKNTSVLSPVFDGQKFFMLGTTELAKSNSETIEGVYSIDVKLILKMRAKGNWPNVKHADLLLMCGLKVPLSSNGKSARSFETTQCSCY